MHLIQFEIEHFDLIELDEGGFVSRGNRELLSAYQKIGPAITLLNDAYEVVACAGVIIAWGGMGEFWMVPGKLVPRYAKSVWKEAKLFIADSIGRYNLHRIQATVRERDARAIRWIERLGFEKEGLMRCFGADRDNHFMYARLINV